MIRISQPTPLDGGLRQFVEPVISVCGIPDDRLLKQSIGQE
jgi:hypothetical protein